jgi:uncharacterized membrane protein
MDLLYWWFDISWRVLRTSYLLIAWNLFLAVIPLVLSVWLFRIAERRSIFWWLIFAIFVAFLPNAPYILTDIIHYVKIARLDVPESVVIFTLTPQYFLFLLSGLQCYVMSLLNLGYYLERRDQERFILPVELLSHFLDPARLDNDCPVPLENIHGNPMLTRVSLFKIIFKLNIIS